MKIISIKTKILSGSLTVGILLSSASTTFAATSNPSNINRKAPFTNECKKIDTKIKQGLDTNVENLVTANTITQTEANKIKAVLNRSEGSKKITSEKTKTMTDQENKICMNNNKINHINPLTSLVSNGTITQDQADKIIMKKLYLYQTRMLHSFL